MSMEADFRDEILEWAKKVDRLDGGAVAARAEGMGVIWGLLRAMCIHEWSLDEFVDELKAEEDFDLREAAARWKHGDLEDLLTPWTAPVPESK